MESGVGNVALATFSEAGFFPKIEKLTPKLKGKKGP